MIIDGIHQAICAVLAIVLPNLPAQLVLISKIPLQVDGAAASTDSIAMVGWGTWHVRDVPSSFAQY